MSSMQAYEQCGLNAIKDSTIKRKFLHVELELEKAIINLFETYQQKDLT